MRKKWRIPLKILAAVCIFAVLLTMVQVVLNQPDSRIYQTVNGFYAEQPGSLDAVYVGASFVYAFWQAPLAWKSHGIKVYPYTIPSLPTAAYKYVIEEARKTQPDALYIVGLNSVKTAYGFGPSQLHRVADYMPFSGTKVRMINDLGARSGVAPLQRLEYYFPIIRFHSTWSTVESSDFLRPLNNLKAGQSYNNFLYGVTDVSHRFLRSEDTAPLPDDQEESMRDLLAYLQENQVRAMFVIVPQGADNANTVGRMNRAEQIAEEAGYDCLNLFRATEEIGMDPAVDYYNELHSNIHGSIKYTEYLAQYLQERYGFADKRGQAGNEDWDQAADDYEELLKPVMLDFELEHAARDTHLAAPQHLEIVPAQNGLQLSWTHEGGADGYAIYRRRPKANNDKVNWTQIGDAAGTDRSYVDVSVGGHTNYLYTVVPYRLADGEPVYGRFDSAGTEADSTLPAVSITRAERTDSGVELAWEEVRGASGYLILRSDGEDGYQVLRDVSNKLRYTDSSADPDTVYGYVVEAYYKRGSRQVEGYWDETLSRTVPVE